MCPDHKLQYFKDLGWSALKIKDLKKRVTQHWKKTYMKFSPSATTAQPVKNPQKVGHLNSYNNIWYIAWPYKSRYAEDESPRTQLGSDHIDVYLKDPPLHADTVKEAGGYIKYWYAAMSTRPSLARMGSDFCSAPGMCYLLWYSKISHPISYISWCRAGFLSRTSPNQLHTAQYNFTDFQGSDGNWVMDTVSIIPWDSEGSRNYCK